ncbi:MAG: hypothetical protein J6A15_01310 [Clostridia bacterium]|nr:hypothetical protein [Clostridia bacterium]
MNELPKDTEVHIQWNSDDDIAIFEYSINLNKTIVVLMDSKTETVIIGTSSVSRLSHKNCKDYYDYYLRNVKVGSFDER